MTTVIGKRMIDGGGVKYHTVGGGVVRDVAGNVFEFLGNLGGEAWLIELTII